MGQIHIDAEGSFPLHARTFSAVEHGHAHAVAQAIAFLAKVMLPEAIEMDHDLHGRSVYPECGFDRPQEG